MISKKQIIGKIILFAILTILSLFSTIMLLTVVTEDLIVFSYSIPHKPFLIINLFMFLSNLYFFIKEVYGRGATY